MGVPVAQSWIRVTRLWTAAALAVLSTTARSDLDAQASRQGALPSLEPRLAHIRSALDKYQDPIVAVRDGYFSTLGCIAYPKGGSEGTMAYAPGGMGVHFLNAQLIGAPIDSLRPQVLIYEPDGQRLRLVAAEWFVPVQAAGGRRPTVFGRELEGPMMGHEPLMPDGLHHYDLHVWLWKSNPLGVFAPTNPELVCPKGHYSFDEAAPKLAPHAHR